MNDDKEEDDIQMQLMFAQFSFMGSNEWTFEKEAILLDSGSTTNIFGAGGKKFLTDFKKVKKRVHIRCNGGVRETNIQDKF